MSCGHDGLSLKVALLDHPFLGDEDLLGRNLHTKVTTGNHDTIASFEDSVEVVKTSLVLNLGDDLDVGTTGSEDTTDKLNVFGGLDE